MPLRNGNTVKQTPLQRIKKYQASEKGKRTLKAYLASPKGKESKRRSKQKYLSTPNGKLKTSIYHKYYSKTLRGKEARRRHRSSVKGKSTARRYKSSPKVKAKEAKYRKSPLRKAVVKKYKKTLKGKLSARRNWLKRNYSITPSQYDKMLVSQNGVCAICYQKNMGGRRLGVDHDHETGRVRALLCGWCNTGIGHFKENIHLLYRTADYIEFHQRIGFLLLKNSISELL